MWEMNVEKQKQVGHLNRKCNQDMYVGNEGHKIYWGTRATRFVVNTDSDGQLSVVCGDRGDELDSIQFILKYDGMQYAVAVHSNAIQILYMLNQFHK